MTTKGIDYPTADQMQRDLRDAAVRRIEGAMALYWEFCKSWCSTGDEAMRVKMMEVRSEALAALITMMPLMLGDGFDTVEADLPADWPASKH